MHEREELEDTILSCNFMHFSKAKSIVVHWEKTNKKLCTENTRNKILNRKTSKNDAENLHALEKLLKHLA